MSNSLVNYGLLKPYIMRKSKEIQDDEPLEGGAKGWAIHAVVVSKDIPEDEARKISQDIIKNNKRNFMREEVNTYRFRNLSKQKFNKFRTKMVNDNIYIIMGRLKNEFKDLK